MSEKLVCVTVPTCPACEKQVFKNLSGVGYHCTSCHWKDGDPDWGRYAPDATKVDSAKRYGLHEDWGSFPAGVYVREADYERLLVEIGRLEAVVAAAEK